MNTKDFLQFVASGQASKAQEVLSDMLSQKAFEALDIKKQQIAQTLYNDGEDIEVQDTADTPVESEEEVTQEEVEQIDELKKSTLGSYVKKASRDLANQSFDHGEDEHRQYGDPEDTEREADMKKRERDIENRQKGINRAASKLSKEEVEQLDEIGDTPAGKKMLGSYLKKRTKQIPNIERNYQMTPYEDGPMGAKTIKKFQKKVNKGMGRAIDRLTK